MLKRCFIVLFMALSLNGKGAAGISGTEVEALLGEYLRMKDALVADNTWGAAMAGGRMMLLLDQAGWAQRVSRLRACADQVSGTGDVEVQRAYFAEMSAMAVLGLEVMGARRYHVFVQHCPMALGGRGAQWLSLHAEVQNPYFGLEMLHCGRVLRKVEGLEDAAPLVPGSLAGTLKGTVMHGCHGPGR